MEAAHTSPVRVALPETRAGRIAYARDTIADKLEDDEQFTGEHGRSFDDSTVVVFKVLAPSNERAERIEDDLGEALNNAGFEMVMCGSSPTPGSDGYTVDVSVRVGAP